MRIFADAGAPLPKLAVDSGFPTALPSNVFRTVLNVDATAGLTEVLALTGRFQVSLLELSGLTSNDVARVVLTIDGVDIIDVVPSSNGTIVKVLGDASASIYETVLVESSLSLKVQTTVDNNISLGYNARPIV